jgi:hypothetical protein
MSQKATKGLIALKVNVKYTLFSLGMVTYSYERQDIIQFALKRLPGYSAVKKNFVRFLFCPYDELMENVLIMSI